MDASTGIEQADRQNQSRSRFSFESVPARSAKYRADVDGLRAVAVTAVIFFHLGIPTFQNGFVGVDVFYVISGYLITSLIAKDLAAGRFSIVMFYERRLRRIFPALFTVLFVCILIGSIVLYPEELTKFGKSLVTTTFFVSNFYFWHSALPTGYFDTTASAAQPLLHTWSLAVEEQFYLLFPLALYLLFRWSRERVNKWLFILTISSFALNLWTTQLKPIVAFYWLMPRAWELLLGALLATKAVPLIRSNLLREIAALLGIGMILCAVCLPMKGLPFPGYIVLLPCVGAWLIIYAGESGPSFVSRILSFGPVVFIGVISYSLYLWHWPAIEFSKHFPFNLRGNAEIAFVLVFSVLAAFVSFEFIERPFRGSASPFSRRQIFAYGFAASVLTAAFGFAAYRSRGLPQRYDPHTRQIVLANQERIGDFDESCANFQTGVHSIGDIKSCDVGDKSQRKILFFGDSHLQQLYPAIKKIFNSPDFRDRSVVTAFAPACLPDEHINNRTANGYHCDSFAKFAMLRAQKEDIDSVFLGFSTWWENKEDDPFCLVVNEECVKALSRNELRRQFLTDLSDEIHLLKEHGKNVIVCLPFPIFRERIPELAMSNAIFGRIGLSRTPKETSSLSLHDEIKAVATNAGADVFDPRETLCTGDRCTTSVAGVSIYKDNNHLARSQVAILESNLRAVLQRNLH
jgi:peptidoglycan/LPS O-acetylase OafA/YrhL